MDLEEKAGLLAKTIQRLEGQIVLVEGKNDARALQKIGLLAKVITATGRPERIISKTTGPVALLFDFDDEGERKTRVFTELFQAAGIQVDLLSRKRLRQALGVKTMEELPSKKRELEEMIFTKR